MAVSSIFMALTFLLLLLETPLASFSFSRFGDDSSFGADIALFGDAEVVGGGSAVQLTRPASSSAGLLVYEKPIKLVEGNPEMKVSFSTDFSFVMSPDNGDGLAFAFLPVGFPVDKFDGSWFGLSPGFGESKFKAFVVEYNTLRDAKSGDLNRNHVGIDLGNSFVSVKVANVSSLNLVLNSGERLHSWIDYEAGSKRFEVRLSKFGDEKPADPLLSYPIDLSELWKEEVLVSLSSSNSNSSQTCSVYSWSFNLRRVPHWMHSQPLDPRAFSEKETLPMVHKRSSCVLRFLAALIFGTGCGALGAFILLYVWTIFGNKHPITPEEFAVCPKEFEYKKIKVVVDKAVKDGEK